MTAKRRAVFLDRDGVLVEDHGLLFEPQHFRILPGVPEALQRLARAGFALVVVSNQAVVARGLISESNLKALHRNLEARLGALGAPALDGFYYCPHHPAATLARYRSDCQCRKPRPGLLLQAARELQLDLAGSFMVGDRPSDLQAGQAAGCRSLWLQTGRHGDPAIETPEPLAAACAPAYVGADLAGAVAWILEAP
jgi:D-glycero-D-manno-heptose 1,7-bisphosphate phosphatase